MIDFCDARLQRHGDNGLGLRSLGAPCPFLASFHIIFLLHHCVGDWYRRAGLHPETREMYGKIDDSPLCYRLRLRLMSICVCDGHALLNGYLSTPTYKRMEKNLDKFRCVQWNVGVGASACFTQSISSIVQDHKIRLHGPFDYVIEVDMKQAAALSFKDMLTIKVGDALGLLDRQEYNRLKEKDDDMRYYSYGLEDSTNSAQNQTSSVTVALRQENNELEKKDDDVQYYTYGLEDAMNSLQNLSSSVALRQIYEKLSTKKYLLVVWNLHKPIKPIKVKDFTEDSCLPPPQWNGSFWLISATSRDVYEKSKPGYECTIESFDGEDILMLTLYSLHQAAKYILHAIGDKDEMYWHTVALRCFHYAAMLLIPFCSSSYGGDGNQLSPDANADINSEELIRQWAAQGIIPIISQSSQERMEQVTHSDHGKFNDDDIYQIGNVIIHAFQEYSLLQLPLSCTTKAEEATKTAAHFLVCSGLVAEQLTIDELYDDSHHGLECMQWISHVGDQGWHVRRDLLSLGSRGPTVLIINHCSQQSTLFAKLDPLLAKFACLCVLDLSYTPLVSLPSSICFLENLQMLSLRGCSNLSSPFRFPDNGRTKLPRKNGNTMISLRYLELSYSNVIAFDRDVFHHVPNLQQLILLKCSNLIELPPSIAALTSLTTLELTRTKIKSIRVDIFVQMNKLQSLKIIGNTELLLIPEVVRKASCEFINQHIEGWDSVLKEEIKLEWHPTLKSFSLIGSPYIKRLSLCGCKKLEFVDIKELDALEELNLSATGIKELPVEIPNLPQLRRLLLIGIPSLRRFPWHEVQRLPDVFCLDQYSDGNGSSLSQPQFITQQVRINDSRFFNSFNSYSRNLVRGGKLFKCFYVLVASCKARSMKMQYEEDTTFIKKLLVSVAYDDVDHCYQTEGVSMVPMDDVPPIRETECHVEISAIEQYPHGLKHLLEVTKSMSMMDDTHVSCLNDLSLLHDLEECLLRRCHKMVYVFRERKFRSWILSNVSVSYLNSLTHLYLKEHHYPDDFRALKHLFLEHCPRLEAIMPRGYWLPSLVTLDILFCYNLKEFFYDKGDSSPYSYQLPCLRRVHLQELPHLNHLHVDDAIITAPAWEELHVRGCWSLRSLPRLNQRPYKMAAVKVSGEPAWWRNLRWDRGEDDGVSLHRHSYQPVFPPASASFGDGVVIKSYLR